MERKSLLKALVLSTFLIPTFAFATSYSGKVDPAAGYVVLHETNLLLRSGDDIIIRNPEVGSDGISVQEVNPSQSRSRIQVFHFQSFNAEDKGIFEEILDEYPNLAYTTESNVHIFPITVTTGKTVAHLLGFASATQQKAQKVRFAITADMWPDLTNGKGVFARFTDRRNVHVEYADGSTAAYDTAWIMAMSSKNFQRGLKLSYTLGNAN